MRYTVIFTHNPQDFFEGSEPDDLAEIKITDDINHETITMILDQIKGGEDTG